MSKQKYLGCLNGVVFCVDGFNEFTIQGRAFHLFGAQPLYIYSFKELFLKLENLYNDLGFPRPAQGDRDFDGNNILHVARGEMKKMKNDNEILEEHGELGTFIIRVQHRQHSSWQGRVTWLDEDKTVYFRSELELMKLIDGAINEKKFDEN